MLAGNAIAQAGGASSGAVHCGQQRGGRDGGRRSHGCCVVARSLPRRARKTPQPLSFSDRVFPNPARVNLAGFRFFGRVAGAKSRRARHAVPRSLRFGTEPFHLARGHAPFSSVLDGRDRVGLSSFATAGPTGLINMPDARFNPDGTLRFGMTYARPYFDLSANATLLPWLEPISQSLGSTVFGIPVRDARIRPELRELQGQERGLQDSSHGGRNWWPAVAIGRRIPSAPAFSEQFAAATKTLGDAQVTLDTGAS